MAFPNLERPNLQNLSEDLDFREKKPLTQKERMELVKKYLTPEGRGNELFAELCLKYFLPIVGKILNSKYPNNVEDVVQVAAFKATRYLGQFTGESSLATWIFHVGANEAFDFLRKVKVRKDISQADPLDNILNAEEDIDSSSAVENALKNAELLDSILEGLNEKEKQILMLHYIDERSIKEMASILGKKENTLKVELFRIRQKAKEYAQKNGLGM